MKEYVLSRRDQTKVAWHEVPGNKRKVDRPGGTVDLLTSPRDIFRRTSPRALLETPDTPLEKFESDEFRFALRYHRDKARGALGLLGSRSEPVPWY